MGDYALATGADSHVEHLGQRLAAIGVAPAWVTIIPADRVALAAAIYRAWMHPDWVISFGGLGDASDDHVRVTIAALQCGREEVGLARLAERVGDGFVECGNAVFFSGQPARAHPAFARWLLEVLSARDDNARRSDEKPSDATESIGWTLPENEGAVAARAAVKRDYPAVMQRVVPAVGEGRMSLRFTGASKGRTQAARKALQRLLATSGEQ